MPVKLSKIPYVLIVLVTALAPAVFAQGTYTQIDVPGASTTTCWGINSADQISGTFGGGTTYHGFLLSDGNVTVIDYPGAQNTYVNGLNDVGQVVGFARTPDVGFVYDVPTQTFTEVSYPDYPLTYPYSINNAGTVVGAMTLNGRKLRGFELIGQTYESVRPPNRVEPVAYGVSNQDEVVGITRDESGNNFENFVFDQIMYRHLKIPNSPNAVIYGINEAGNAVAGEVSSVSGAPGFVYRKGHMRKLAFPGAQNTAAYGVNDAGKVVGVMDFEDVVLHCFLWTPPTK